MQYSNKKYCIEKNSMLEISFISETIYDDPFNDIELNIRFTGPDGSEMIVPAFWAGEKYWSVRYSSHVLGKHDFRSECSISKDTGLHKIEGSVLVSEYTGKNKLLKHGKLRISKDNRHIEHEDGTPFFWLGDTWWYGFTKNFKWPEIFRTLSEDRVRKGFSIIHIIAGLYPDFGKKFIEFESSETGFVWDNNFTSINPYFFDAADIKIFSLINSELTPCIFGAWGYYLPWLGVEKMKKHWRYIISRWGALPVVWSVAGEATMPFYARDFTGSDKAVKEQETGWPKIAKYIKDTDPFKRLLTLHPSPFNESYSTRDALDPDIFDIDMLCIGHRGQDDLDVALEKLQKAVNANPPKPVFQGEINYEGIMDSSGPEIQRFLFWTHIMSGAMGYSYGAAGIMDIRIEKYENHPGICGTFASYSWEEAMNFLGSCQLGFGKKFLEQFAFNKMKPHPEIVEPHWNEKNRMLPYAATIDNKIRIIYFPPWFLIKDMFSYYTIRIKKLDKKKKYLKYFFDPRSGAIVDKEIINANNDGEYIFERNWLVALPSWEDWILVVEDL